MRFLAWHVDYFKCRITERGRSPVVEEYDDFYTPQMYLSMDDNCTLSVIC